MNRVVYVYGPSLKPQLTYSVSQLLTGNNNVVVVHTFNLVNSKTVLQSPCSCPPLNM